MKEEEYNDDDGDDDKNISERVDGGDADDGLKETTILKEKEDKSVDLGAVITVVANAQSLLRVLDCWLFSKGSTTTMRIGIGQTQLANQTSFLNTIV